MCGALVETGDVGDGPGALRAAAHAAAADGGGIDHAPRVRALMVIVGLVAAGLILVALTVAAAVVGALAWLFLAAASTASSVAA